MDTSNYKEVQRKLASVDPELKKQLKKDMKVLAGTVVTEARALASWSATIPAAIRPTSTALGAGVRVSGSVPIAVLNERRAGAWRHPVFGNREVWVSQKARPSVRPVVEAKRAVLAATAEEIARAALRSAGF